MTDRIITVGRQFGSNGREIGRMLANKLNIPFYDKELLTETAKKSGFSEKVLSGLDEKPTQSFLYSIVMDPYSYGFTNTGFQNNISQQAFQAIYDTINCIGEQGPCVIVGRCADYALRHTEKLLRLFIHAPLEERIKTIAERFDISEGKAKSQITKEDKSRTAYYNYYTSKKWGSLDSYDLFINSSLLSLDDTVDYIIGYLDKMK